MTTLEVEDDGIIHALRPSLVAERAGTVDVTIPHPSDGDVERQYTLQQLRLGRRAAPASHVKVGDEIEACQSEDSQVWYTGKVMKVKQDFLHVQPDLKGAAPFWTELENTRERQAIPSGRMQVQCVAVHGVSLDWLASDDGRGMMRHAVKQVDFRAHACKSKRNVHKGRNLVVQDCIAVFGEDEEVISRTVKVIELHLMFQREIVLYEDRIDAKRAQLDKLQEHHSEGRVRELWIPSEASGIIIGKGGENIKQLMKKYKCDIRVDPDATDNQKMVQISGDDRALVDECAKECTFIRKRIKIDQSVIAHVLGKKGRQLREIEDKSGVGRIHVVGDEGDVDIIGRPEQVDDATLLLEAHVKHVAEMSTAYDGGSWGESWGESWGGGWGGNWK